MVAKDHARSGLWVPHEQAPQLGGRQSAESTSVKDGCDILRRATTHPVSRPRRVASSSCGWGLIPHNRQIPPIDWHFQVKGVTCTVRATRLRPAVGSGLVEVPVEAGAVTPLRGEIAVTRKTDLMEKVQEAQFRASAAAAGCSIAKPDPDDGTDWVVFHRNADHVVARQVSIEVQLRSTSQIAPPLGDELAFAVDNDTFDRLTERTIFPRVLIVCILPPNIEEWVNADQVDGIFQLRHLSYWHSLYGTAKTGRTQTTVHIPTSHVFDDVALCNIMQRVGRGEAL